MQTETAKPDIAGKPGTPIDFQIGPTPGYAFAVYKDNTLYHTTTRDDWMRCATSAAEALMARLGHEILRMYPEHGRPYNLAIEYRAS